MAVRKASLLVLAAAAIAPPLLVVARSLQAGAYAKVLSAYGGALLFSLELATAVVTATLVLAVPASYAFVRYPLPRALEQFAMLPLTVPGVTVAVALITAFGAFRGGPLVLACGQMLYTIPYVVGVMTASLRAASIGELDDAARTLGATSAQRWRHIILPLLRHPLTIAAMIAFAISWGEFNVTYLLATPLQMPFSAALFTAYTSESLPVAGAATAIFILGALPFLAGIQFAGERF
jgi:putative spermidine/putrescine transport system permease protein